MAPKNAVKNPIINSPHEEPARYWDLDGDAARIVEGERRPAAYFYIPPSAEMGEDGAKGSVKTDIPAVNIIREKLAAWRKEALGGGGGATKTTTELLNYWRRDGREHRLFFAQLEAAETIIFLTEADAEHRKGINLFLTKAEIKAKKDKKGKAGADKAGAEQEIYIPLDEPDEPDKPEEDKQREERAAFKRLCCKMATGAGKTTVMGMLAAWSILNKVADKNSERHASDILIVCPNVTIRDRLAELDPRKGDASVYRTRDLCPPNLMPKLQRGKALVTNWHVFERQSAAPAKVMKAGEKLSIVETLLIGDKKGNKHDKRYITEAELRRRKALGTIVVLSEEHDKQGNLKSAKARTDKYVESDAALARRALGREFGVGARRNIMVFNDEAHHAYRLRREEREEGETTAALSPDDGGLIGDEGEAEEFRKEATVWVDGLDRIHKERGVLQCVDFSATPYFLGRAGEDVNRVFPWTVSDFGLHDAIESGLVKIPQLAARDATGAEVPGYFNIWKWILPQLTTAEKGGRKGEANPAAVLKYANTPIAMLGGMWEAERRNWAERGEKRPPVFIIVCKTTKLAKVVFDWLANDRPPPGVPSANLPALKNADGAEHTVRIDSKVNKESAAGGAQKDEDEWMRHVLATVGKEAWPTDKQGRILHPPGFAELAEKTGKTAFLARPPGRDIRCIVSVGMLTEGWDCNTVTHIIGLRPFMSQLLCEQVIGRGLRRASYEIDEDTGLMSEELARALGVPLSIYPVKAAESAQKKRPARHHIFALPQKAEEYEIRFPRVEGYRRFVRRRLFCDVDKAPGVLIDGANIPQEVELRAALLDNRGRMIMGGPGAASMADLENFRRQMRLQGRIFEMTHALMSHYVAEADEAMPANVLFAQLHQIVADYIARRVEVPPHSDVKDAFLSPWYGYIIERLRANIRPDVESGETPELPRYERDRGAGSTSDVDFHTRRQPYPVEKSHVNAVAPDTKKLEQSAAWRLDKNDHARAFVKNEGLGFAVPYEHNGLAHDYLPDFLVRLDNGDTLILETKGYDPLKEVKEAAAERWVRAVNNDGKHGRWHYRMIASAGETDAAIESCRAAGEKSA